MKVLSKSLLALLLFSSSSLATSSLEEVVVFGDSISAGAFADFYAKPRNMSETVIPRFLLSFFGEWQKFLDAGIYSIPLNHIENRNKSWATGSKFYGGVPSLVHRLINNGYHVKRKKNFAITGATSYDVLKQVKRWHPKSRNSLGIVLIGANDLCVNDIHNVTPVKDFKNNLRTAIRQLKTKSNHIFAVFPPDLVQLMKEVESEEVQIFNQRKKCSTVLERHLKFCKALTVDPTGENSRFIHELQAQYLRNFVDLVDEEEVGWSEETYFTQFDIEDLSIDCFHPNTRGQGKLAETVFPDLLRYLNDHQNKK